MEPASDSRFDPNYAAQVLLEIAHEQSVEQLLQKLVGLVVQRPNLACVQVWLIDKGDLCSACRHRPQCQDQARCLHLVTGRGAPLTSTATDAPRFDDSNARIPLGMGFLGKAAVSAAQRLLKDLDQHPGETAGFDWLQSQRVRALSATPIIFKGEVLGVIVGFTRADIPAEARPWGRIFADHIGAAIANARAFEEIQRLKAQLELQNAYLREEVVQAKAFGDLVGQSGALRQVISQIDLVAPTEASVLILGDTGTGKELVACEIHRRSQRKDGPLVRVNCPSIPKDLFESEFFGHVKGAFTGAVKDRPGRFETAEGGTIFLDEIGEVPLELQSKLLRVLQDGEFERLGSHRTIKVDTRVIAATSRDLQAEIRNGRFREDLYYRLNVFPISIPPLRMRSGDIPQLVQYFIDRFVRKIGRQIKSIPQTTMKSLQEYAWPGNVRELEHVIERAVITSMGPVLQLADRLEHKGPEAKQELPKDLAEMEREHILRTLQQTRWKINGENGAAALLKIHPSTLRFRIKKLGIERP